MSSFAFRLHATPFPSFDEIVACFQALMPPAFCMMWFEGAPEYAFQAHDARASRASRRVFGRTSPAISRERGRPPGARKPDTAEQRKRIYSAGRRPRMVREARRGRDDTPAGRERVRCPPLPPAASGAQKRSHAILASTENKPGTNSVYRSS